MYEFTSPFYSFFLSSINNLQPNNEEQHAKTENENKIPEWAHVCVWYWWLCRHKNVIRFPIYMCAFPPITFLYGFNIVYICVQTFPLKVIICWFEFFFKLFYLNCAVVCSLSSNVNTIFVFISEESSLFMVICIEFLVAKCQ